ncbi:MAG: helix-turn-helix domain-containing protein [Bacilli bacterium]|nr:helix-turn-helix domain-containing protein [Bacilli bacterium]
MINLKRLKDIREDNDLSQKEMAEILNEKRSTYSLWEIGNNIIPIKKLSEFADYFNVSIDYVLSLTNDKGNIIKGFDHKKIGENIKHIRIKNNLTQEALGKMLDITQAGVASSLYGLLKQSDRQHISKYFKISDKLLKQILKNLTSIRNICAHNERLFCFRDKYTINFKIIDKYYKSKDNTTNLYMLINTLKLILEKKEYKEMISLINKEIKILKSKLHSINIEDILKIMGYPNV